MKTLAKTGAAIVVLLAVFGAAFQAGRSAGFKTGSEWALVQADMLAREAGVFMPVYMEGDTFRVVIKQPHGIYRRAWKQADRHEDAQERRIAKLKSTDEREETNTHF